MYVQSGLVACILSEQQLKRITLNDPSRAIFPRIPWIFDVGELVKFWIWIWDTSLISRSVYFPRNNLRPYFSAYLTGWSAFEKPDWVVGGCDIIKGRVGWGAMGASGLDHVYSSHCWKWNKIFKKPSFEWQILIVSIPIGWIFLLKVTSKFYKTL